MELLNLIPKAFKNADKIIEGVVNTVKLELNTLPQDQQDEIVRRRVICATCPLQSENATTDGWYTSDLPFTHCTVCKCNINAKTACLSCNCGLELLKDNQELKWTSYEK